MKNILLASAIVLASFQLKAQQTSLSNPVIPERKIHTFYVEAFGQSLYYSFNYDRLLFTKKRFPGTFSVGLSVLPTPDYTQISVPFSFNGLIGKGSHHLELGIGVTPMYFRERMKSIIGNQQIKEAKISGIGGGLLLVKKRQCQNILNTTLIWRSRF